MTQNAGPGGGQPRPRWWRAGEFAAALAGTAVLAAACGGSAAAAGPRTFRGGSYEQALAYTKCMRARGVPDFPDPSPQGNFSTSQVQLIAQSVLQARQANLACRGLLANGGFQGSATELQQQEERLMTLNLRYAVCMRAHGFPDFPDPEKGPGGYGVLFPVSPGTGFDPSSPQYQAADKACKHVRNGSGGGS
jgi:hypothetical protein